MLTTTTLTGEKVTYCSKCGAQPAKVGKWELTTTKRNDSDSSSTESSTTPESSGTAITDAPAAGETSTVESEGGVAPDSDDKSGTP